MILVRSAIWLSMAYLFIGPQLQLPSTNDIWISQALDAGRKIIVQEVADIKCTTLECVGAKLAVSANIDAGVEVVSPLPVLSTPAYLLHAPVPQPRLVRVG